MRAGVRCSVFGVLLLVTAGCATQPAVSSAPAPSPVDALVEQLASEPARIEARTKLLAMGAAAVPDLLRHTRHSSTMVRWELANILGPLGDARALEALVHNATADENTHVRWRSLWALSHYEIEPVTRALRTRLQSEDEPTQWNAAVALSFFDLADGLELVHANVRNPDQWRRWEAINALGRIHNEASPDVLAQALRSPAEGDRKEAALSLGMIGGPKSTALLVTALDDSSPEVRWRACLSLGRVGDLATVPALRALEAKEQDPMVLEQLQLALGKMK